MKLRLDKNSITIRIEPHERTELQNTGNLIERISIDQNNFFQFSVSISEQNDTITASFIPNQLIVLLPKKQAENWLASGQVGIRSNVMNAQKNVIQLVIEEDLPPRKKRMDS